MLNCLTHALDRWVEYGGYVAFRRSHHWDVPHAIWMDAHRKQLTSYVPPLELDKAKYSLYGFEGEVRDDDTPAFRPISPNGVVIGAFFLLLLAVCWRVRRMTVWSWFRR